MDGYSFRNKELFDLLSEIDFEVVAREYREQLKTGKFNKRFLL